MPNAALLLLSGGSLEPSMISACFKKKYPYPAENYYDTAISGKICTHQKLTISFGRPPVTLTARPGSLPALRLINFPLESRCTTRTLNFCSLLLPRSLCFLGSSLTPLVRMMASSPEPCSTCSSSSSSIAAPGTLTPPPRSWLARRRLEDSVPVSAAIRARSFAEVFSSIFSWNSFPCVALIMARLRFLVFARRPFAILLYEFQ
mmetsp:Transcript_19350/g.43888  ORF Transcript_19350/g.43888 Transcript_19350/m.43888 type:complete len:204 (-) Transcript_19350:33-644(-)